MDFSKTKASRLKCMDLSRKGEIDKFIVNIVEIINSHDSYFTTSSCSGRVILFSEGFEDHAVKKRGCLWLFVSHESASTHQLVTALKDTQGEAIFKFEPFVLHIQCESIDHARMMHQVAVSSGFRNSGITIGNGGKIMMAVRSTHGLEVPVTKEGKLMVSEEYLDFIVDIANSKMKENFTRIEKFQNALQGLLLQDTKSKINSDSSKKKCIRRCKDKKTGKNRQTQTDGNDLGNCVNRSLDYEKIECESDNGYLASCDIGQRSYRGSTPEYIDQGKDSTVVESGNESDCDDLQGFSSIFNVSDENR